MKGTRVILWVFSLGKLQEELKKNLCNGLGEHSEVNTLSLEQQKKGKSVPAASVFPEAAEVLVSAFVFQRK